VVCRFIGQFGGGARMQGDGAKEARYHRCIITKTGA
jgi:hypothetical protein